MSVKENSILSEVAGYYTTKLAAHGRSARGVDWNGEEGQALRFAQLCKIISSEANFSINDLGCGYGALVDYLDLHHKGFSYRGYDVAESMVTAAKKHYGDAPGIQFHHGADMLEADFSVASGIFNVRLSSDEPTWRAYLETTLDALHKASRRGFAFNCLTSYSDAEKMRSDLHYADPCALFDLCKRRYSKQVALLHDYGLYEFTILVRKEAA